MAVSPLLPVYRRADVTMVRGEGCYLQDAAGKHYLDFATGIGVSAFGHAHPALVKALTEQAQTLWHCSNAYHSDALDRYAAALVGATFADKVFFTSSGTEAVEAAIKVIRRYHFAKGHPDKIRILVAEGAFHGRTLGALAACSHAKSKEGFGPMLEGFDVVPFNDSVALEKAITPQTAGILLETIQGEGGIRAHAAEYLKHVRAMCDTHDLLLCFDEVQCGFGRTGHLFAYEPSGVEPDLLTAAKAIGGGFPLGALLLTDDAAAGMTPGSHGSTYGGNALAMAVGAAALGEMTKPGFLEQVRQRGAALKKTLETLVKAHPSVFTGVRGEGLMLGLALAKPESKYPLTEALRDAGLLVAPAVSDVLRILPPFIIENRHIEEAVEILGRVASAGKQA